MIRSGRLLLLLSAAALLVLVTWPLQARLAALLYLALFLPLYLLITSAVNSEFVSHQRIASVYDKAGQFARGRLAPSDLAQLTITGAPLAELMRTKFHLDAPAAKLMAMPDGVPLALSQAPATSKWLLVVGNHALPPELKPAGGGPGYNLIRLPDPVRILGSIGLSSAKPNLTMLAAVEGLSKPEPWGRWSDDAQVRLRLTQPLPRKLVVIMNVRAFGPNVGQDFLVRVGTQERRFQAEETESERTLHFETDGSAQELVIVIPAPSHPTLGGQIIDERRLGLGLSEIRIGTPGAD